MVIDNHSDAQILLLNKPYDVLCQFTDCQGRKTLKNYVSLKNFYAAGRLDRDSEGLLVLTDNGKLQQLISHPKFKCAKTYWVQVENIPSESALKHLELGVELKDGITSPCLATIIPAPKIWDRTPPIRHREKIPTTWLKLTLTEGRNRQIRRMTAAIGHPTLRLIRTSVGPWNMGELKPGKHNLLKQPLSDLPQVWQQQLIKYNTKYARVQTDKHKSRKKPSKFNKHLK